MTFREMNLRVFRRDPLPHVFFSRGCRIWPTCPSTGWRP